MSTDKFEYEEVELHVVSLSRYSTDPHERARTIRERGEAGWVLVATFPAERSLTLGFQRRIPDPVTVERRDAVDELLRILGARGRTLMEPADSRFGTRLVMEFTRSDRDYDPIAQRAVDILKVVAPRSVLKNPLDEV